MQPLLIALFQVKRWGDFFGFTSNLYGCKSERMRIRKGIGRGKLKEKGR